MKHTLLFYRHQKSFIKGIFEKNLTGQTLVVYKANMVLKERLNIVGM